MIDKGSEAEIFEVAKDDQRFAMKRRRNPANNSKLHDQDILREYQCYLKEIEIMSHCNHVNIVAFEESFRD